jgi:hypothetical protein
LAKLREPENGHCSEPPADLTAAVDREAALAQLASAFCRLPERTRRRYPRPVTGSSLTDTSVFVETEDVSHQNITGVIVDGGRDENGEWLLDGQFTVFTTDEELIIVSGWGCHVDVQ